jgi:hypothetical protein
MALCNMNASAPEAERDFVAHTGLILDQGEPGWAACVGIARTRGSPRPVITSAYTRRTISAAVGLRRALLLRENDLAVEHHIELAEAAEPNLRCDAERAREVVAEAHGLLADVASDEAALDLDIHDQSITPAPECSVTSATDRLSPYPYADLGSPARNGVRLICGQ